MKKLFLLTLCICISLSFSFCQTSKGTKFWVVGGGYGHSKKTTDFYDKIYNPNGNSRIELFDSYSMNIGFGKFIRNNVAQGFGIGYSYLNFQRIDSKDTSNLNYNSFQIEKNIYLKYFIIKYIPIFPRLYAFGEANGIINYRIDKDFQNNRENEAKNSIISLGLKMGIRYAIKKTFFIDATTDVASAYYAVGNNNISKQSSFGIYGLPQFNQFSVGLGKIL